MTDCTLIIPCRIDFPDRLRNLTTVVNYLQKHVDTNIHIVEHDNELKVPEELATRDGVSYQFLKSLDPLFFKTLCINDGFKFTNTPYIAVYDTDVLLKIEQLEATMNELRSGKASVIYPYDGTFLDVPESIIPGIISSLSVEEIDHSKCEQGFGRPEITPDRQSFGGCVFFERKAFIGSGGMNQRMISYSAEDLEVYIRCKKLGYTISRILGPIYHLHHQRGINSKEQHHMVAKNEAEFQKILNMDVGVLKLFVSTWPWIQGVR